MVRTSRHLRHETDWRKRVSLAVFGLTAVVLAYTMVYQWAVFYFVGQSISFMQALHVVIEALTTAGFGGDTDLWRQSDGLTTLVILMNLTGVLLVFLAIPLFFFPVLRTAFDTRPPTSTTLTDHIVICGFSPQDEVLSRELEAAGIPYLYIDEDAELITQLVENGVNGIVGDAADSTTLESANVESALAVVVDIDDESNPAVLLSAKQINPDVRAISVIRDPAAETYHRYAKADDIVLSRKLLGQGLGHRAAGTFAEKLRDTIEVDTDFEVTELRIEQNSKFVGQTLEAVASLNQLGISVVGAWVGGKFVISPGPDMIIEENTILLVAGNYQIPDHVRATPIPHHEADEPRVIVCGYGTVGRAVTETLQEEGITVEVIDIQDKPGVDIVGNIADPETFAAADLDQARAVVFSIDEDVTTIYATLIVNHLAPDVELIVRADDAKRVQEMYNAGADFVLSLPDVTGEILASLLIEDIEIVTPDINFAFERVEATDLGGSTLAQLHIRRQTGCVVVAVERAGELLTDPTGSFMIEANDILILAGSMECQERFAEWVEQRGNTER